MKASGGMIETYRGGVAAWECDVFGHLNIAFYVERFGDAALDLLERHAPGWQWRSVAVQTRYERELRGGDGLFIRSCILEVGETVVRLGHEACNSATGERTTVVEHILAPDSSEIDEWPELRRRLAEAVASWDVRGFDPVSLPEGDGPIVSGRDRVKAWESGPDGRLALFGHVQRFANAALHVLDTIGMHDTYRRAAQRGFSTFETRMVLESTAAAGEGVSLTSAVLEVGSSSVRLIHRMRETKTARAVAYFYQGGVHFDLQARRSVPFPPELRDRALALRVAPSS